MYWQVTRRRFAWKESYLLRFSSLALSTLALEIRLCARDLDELGSRKT
jgi:hypothetical protein